MSAAQPNASSNAFSLAIWIAVGTVALVIGIIMLTRLAVSSYGSRSLDPAAMTPEALAARIGPVAKLQLEGAAAVAPAAAAAPKVAAVAAAPAKAKDGKSVYDTVCMACHMTGAANAPKLGDKAAWAPRIKTGNDALVASVLKGKGAMPPKGGGTALSDAEIKAAVEYMVAQSK
ncbi:MAG: cytochrome c5 family protein [Betaproteobacteria bacterium]|nr:cytochrome c5 family protein [Betaproteobacteria bacterium]